MKKMQKILVLTVILAGVGVLIGAASAQFSRPEDAIKYRKSVMVIITQHFGRLGAMVKGAQPFDQDKFASNAAIVDDMSKLPWEAFLVAGSDRGDTTMKSSVLKDSDQFKKLAASFQQETGRLAGVAKDGEADAARRQFGKAAQRRVHKGEIHRDQERYGHGRDFAYGIDPPPEPSEEKEKARARADLKEDFKGLKRVFQNQRKAPGEYHHDHGGKPAHEDEFLLSRVRCDEPFIEIVHHVRRSPIQMRRDRRHVRGDQRCQDEAEQPVGQEGEHRRIRQVVADFVRGQVREGLLQRLQVGEDDQRA